MSATHKGLASRELDRLFRHGVVSDCDGALLAGFFAGGDESAFEAIVARHGPMVLGVCRRLLVDPHDADDAFQATFLVLVRKAGRIRDADRLGPWLYGVATRVATKARARDVRRKSRTAGPVEIPSPPEDRSDWLDVGPILDAELGRLPAKFRDILVLCLLEGSTPEEVARRLACPLGTVKSRLARGREALRSRLTVRGIARPAAAAVAAGSSRSSVASPVSQALSRTTQGVAGLAPERIPAGVAALTRGVAPSMFRSSKVLTAVACGGLALGGIGLAARPRSEVVAAQGQAPRGNPDQARAESMDHFKMILLALHNYHSTNDHFPPAAIAGKDGKPLLSWRVAILPYLDAGDLYNRFRLFEPWDSPHNRELLGEMPDVFKTPDAPAGLENTRIQGFSGKGAMFDGPGGIAVKDVTDGTSNTIMIAEGNKAVPWTKPDDLTTGKPWRGLSDDAQQGVVVGFADGSARNITVQEYSLLPALISRAGGEVFAWPSATQSPAGQPTRPAIQVYQPTPTPAPAPGMPMMPGAATPAPAPASSIPPELEKRLRGIEDRLDQVLKKLDATGGGAGRR